MKTCKWMTAMMLCAGFSLSACTSDDGLSSPSETGQGQLMLNLVSGTKFTEDTRAVNENDYKITDKYTVVVIDANNIEKLKDDYHIVAKMNLITYEPVSHSYFALGEKVGNAFSDGKKLK